MDSKLSDRLARFIAEKDQEGLALFRSIYELCANQIQAQQTESAALAASNSGSSQPGQAIGIWQQDNPNDKDSVFIRQEAEDAAFWETTRQTLNPVKANNCTRVCLLGESAAAGMFFTPVSTPAKALETILGRSTGDRYEVIDLTRNSINAGSILSLCESVEQINPDYVVVFAGNNWFAGSNFEHNLPATDRKINALTPADFTLAGIAKKYQSDFIEKALQVFDQLIAIEDKSRAQYILLLPASNHLGWQRRMPIPWLGNTDTAKWYQLYDQASACLDKQQYSEAHRLGLKMLALDQGYSSASNRVMIDALVGMGKVEESYAYCQAEADYANICDQISPIPALPSFARDQIKNYQPNQAIRVIDLADILAEFTGSKILDNSLFIDFCHLNVEGFFVSMASVADAILQQQARSTQQPLSHQGWKTLLDNVDIDAVEPFNLAAAYFYIGLYNLHLNQPVNNNIDTSLGLNYFAQAISASESILAAMENYVSARSVNYGKGFMLSKAGQRLFECSNSPLDIAASKYIPGVDAYAMDALCNSLDAHGKDGSGLLKRYQAQYLPSLEEGIDLSHPLYIERVTAAFRLSLDPEIGSRRSLPIYKSWWPRSYFTLVSEGQSAIEFTLTLRSQGLQDSPEENTTVSIGVNDNYTFETPIIHRWNTAIFMVDKKYLKKGFNRIAIKWPRLHASEHAQIQDIYQRYAAGLKVDLFPVFGEVFSFIAKKAD